MLVKFYTDTVLQPHQYVVWNKARQRVRAFGMFFNDSPCDIVGKYIGNEDTYPFSTAKPPRAARPNEVVYIETDCER